MTRIAVTNLDQIINGRTTGRIQDEHGHLIEDGAFGFDAHEDIDEWERLADAELARYGWTRTSDWAHNTDGDLAASITRASE